MAEVTPELQAEFDAAAKDATGGGLPDSVSNDDRLLLYGLFKQATVGDNATSKPGIFDPKGRAKWDAWDKVKGKGKVDAMKEYIELVNGLKTKYAA